MLLVSFGYMIEIDYIHRVGDTLLFASWTVIPLERLGYPLGMRTPQIPRII